MSGYNFAREKLQVFCFETIERGARESKDQRETLGKEKRLLVPEAHESPARLNS
jgi:hypothetical protein